MNRLLIGKVVGACLVLSSLLLLVLKAASIPEARQSWAAFAEPNSGTIFFVVAVTLELLLLAARFTLGYFTYLNKKLSLWLFFPLLLLVALNDLSGIVLASACLILRFWPLNSA